MLNVRLDDDTEKALKKYAEDQEMTKSQVVKEALALYLAKKDLQEQPFRLGSDLFGADASGDSSLSVTYKSKLKEKLSAKRSR